MNITDEDIENELSSGKWHLVHPKCKWLLEDYDETAYDNYFVERQEKIDQGELIISSNEGLDDALSAFEAIDWGIFGDYDYYYNY